MKRTAGSADGRHTGCRSRPRVAPVEARAPAKCGRMRATAARESSSNADARSCRGIAGGRRRACTPTATPPRTRRAPPRERRGLVGVEHAVEDERGVAEIGGARRHHGRRARERSRARARWRRARRRTPTAAAPGRRAGRREPTTRHRAQHVECTAGERRCTCARSSRAALRRRAPTLQMQRAASVSTRRPRTTRCRRRSRARPCKLDEVVGRADHLDVGAAVEHVAGGRDARMDAGTSRSAASA